MKKLIVYFFLCFSLQAMAQTEVNERVGYARDVDTGELLYTESHKETYENGQIISDKVTYRDADGNVFGEKDVDYTSNAIMPDFELKNFETGHRELASKRQSELEVVFSPTREARAEREVIALPDNGIIDAGFDRFIIEHWQELTQGEKLVRKMLIPSMKEFVNFRIYQASVDKEAGMRVLKVEPNSALLRFLADPLVLEYDIDTPRLYTFEGTSNMRDKNGDNLQVNITFPKEEYRLTSN